MWTIASCKYLSSFSPSSGDLPLFFLGTAVTSNSGTSLEDVHISSRSFRHAFFHSLTQLSFKFFSWTCFKVLATPCLLAYLLMIVVPMVYHFKSKTLYFRFSQIWFQEEVCYKLCFRKVVNVLKNIITSFKGLTAQRMQLQQSDIESILLYYGHCNSCCMGSNKVNDIHSV